MEMPKYLIVLVKRYTYNRENQQIVKVNKQIESGTYNRQFHNIIIKVTDTTYKLLSTVLHKGPLPNQGHYISIIKKNGQYYQINDHKVEQIDDITRTYGS